MKHYTIKEEVLNATTHFIGAALSIAGLVFLIFRGVVLGSPLAITAFSIYGACMILMYLSSGFYHSFQGKTVKKVFRVFDHCAIFLMIAGSFTPVILLSLEGLWRILSLILIWAVAIGGIVFKSVTVGKFDKYNKISLMIFLTMGWLAVFILPQIYRKEGLPLILLLALGGALYSIGTIFYENDRIPYNHGIWHIFIILASAVQYFAILFQYGFR